MHSPPVETVETIPTEKLRAALLEAALPGVFGKVSIDLYLTSEAVNLFDVVVRQKFSCPAKAVVRDANGEREDPRREYAVSHALHAIGERMRRRACLVRVDFHFADGELMKYDVDHVR